MGIVDYALADTLRSDAPRAGGLEAETQAPADVTAEAPKLAQINGAGHVSEKVADSNHHVGDIKPEDKAQTTEASPAANPVLAGPGDTIATAQDAPAPAANAEQKPDTAEASVQEPVHVTAPEQPTSTATVDDKPESVAAGGKRELNALETADATEANTGGDQPSEPAAKKQKVEEANGAGEESANIGAKDEPAHHETNGDQKPTRSKSKKVKDVLKQAVATDGIGSRTRSRTKSTASS